MNWIRSTQRTILRSTKLFNVSKKKVTGKKRTKECRTAILWSFCFTKQVPSTSISGCSLSTGLSTCIGRFTLIWLVHVYLNRWLVATDFDRAIPKWKLSAYSPQPIGHFHLPHVFNLLCGLSLVKSSLLALFARSKFRSSISSWLVKHAWSRMWSDLS